MQGHWVGQSGIVGIVCGWMWTGMMDWEVSGWEWPGFLGAGKPAAVNCYVTNLGCVRGQYHTTMNKHTPLKV